MSGVALGYVDAVGSEERALELVGDGHDPGLEAEGVAEMILLLVQDLEQALADGAAADESDLVFHGSPPRSMRDDTIKKGRRPRGRRP
jgi:hypothetical protein